MGAYLYVEIVEGKTEEVVARYNVTGESDRSIDKIIAGASINLNHAEYSIRKKYSAAKLDKI